MEELSTIDDAAFVLLLLKNGNLELAEQIVTELTQQRQEEAKKQEAPIEDDAIPMQETEEATDTSTAQKTAASQMTPDIGVIDCTKSSGGQIWMQSHQLELPANTPGDDDNNNRPLQPEKTESWSQVVVLAFEGLEKKECGRVFFHLDEVCAYIGSAPFLEFFLVHWDSY